MYDISWAEQSGDAPRWITQYTICDDFCKTSDRDILSVSSYNILSGKSHAIKINFSCILAYFVTFYVDTYCIAMLITFLVARNVSKNCCNWFAINNYPNVIHHTAINKWLMMANNRLDKRFVLEKCIFNLSNSKYAIS